MITSADSASKRDQLEALLRTALAAATACGRGEVPRDEAPEASTLAGSILSLLETPGGDSRASAADPRPRGIAA